MSTPLVELKDIVKTFGSVIALNGVSTSVDQGQVLCLLGDNGAGKSTLIKTLSGVHTPTSGQIYIEGQAVTFRSPRDAQRYGIATVHQHLSIQPLMSVTRNFFMGREPVGSKMFGALGLIRHKHADHTARDEMLKMGIDIRDPNQVVGTMSGGERQVLAIARAIYFGARVLILDEPTAALGVKQAGVVLKYIAQVRAKGLAVVFITHNVHHAYPVADKFTILKRGQSYGTFMKSDVSREDVLAMMAGKEELEALEAELEEFSRADQAKAAGQDSSLEAAAAAEHAIAEGLHQEVSSLKGKSS
ncbi:MAG: ATP-binding cassette domain-containing protein [Deinococcota bacterium]